jgi:class 3 adenylate cyclase/predicted ATPase
MDFYELLDRIIELLQQRGRVTYRALKRQFNLDDEMIEDLKEELIYGQRVAVDEDGRVLVWAGAVSTGAPSCTAQPPLQEGPHAEPHAPDAERRQLTVLFCDLVDSTVLAARLDPEEWREVVRTYQEACAKVIARFEGYIAQYLGDGLLVYFGYPLAHEDDAQRAVRAGLGMVEAIGQLNTRLAQERRVQLAVRLGCHTGLVVVGEVGGGTRQEQLALGETPNLAARLQGITAPNTVVISAATVPLLGGFFACQALGPSLLKGFTQPLEVYQVLSESTARSRLEAEFLYQQGVPPQATYRFKHALIQDAAYQSLLKSTRQQYHQRIAQVLEARFPDLCETQPELLAHHYTEAGLLAQAIVYWQRAGQRAIAQSAYVEAIRHLTQGLELLHALPDTPERTQQELDLQMVLGPALMALKGWAAPEVERVYTRAMELCRQLGEIHRLAPVLRGLWEFYELQGKVQIAQELGEQLLELARSGQESALLVVAHDALGDTLLWRGEFVRAREHLEHGITLYEPQHHAVALLYGGYDPGVACRNFAAHVLWYLGYPDQALQRSQEAISLARELSHPFSLALALFFATWLHHYRREGHLTQERAAAVNTLSTEQGFAFFGAWGGILGGWAVVEQGQVEAGILQIRQGLEAYRATGAILERPYQLALLAEACGRAGQAAEGRRLLEEACVAMDHMAVRFCEAEVSRLKGELLLRQSLPDEQAADVSFQQALDVARRQEAKALELRAAMSLARLWQQQGKRVEARELLAPIYGWFTEGFDTADLQEAKALLEALA